MITREISFKTEDGKFFDSHLAASRHESEVKIKNFVDWYNKHQLVIIGPIPASASEVLAWLQGNKKYLMEFFEKYE